MNSRIWKIFIGALALLAAAHCNTTDRTRRGYLREAAAALPAPARPVIVIAGFGVTQLIDPVTNRNVWGTAHAMWQRAYPDDLDLPVHGTTIGRDRLIPRGWVGSRGPINIGWQLTEALRKFGRYERDVNVYPFYYDWRLPARENAERLRAFVDDVRAKHGGAKVDLITHSAGALVATTYVKLSCRTSSPACPPPQAALRAADKLESLSYIPVEHLILIAPTQRGTVEAFRLLVRGERFIRRAFTPEMAATWPFVAELLPENDAFLVDERGNVHNGTEVLRARFHSPAFDQALADARAFRQQLNAAPWPKSVHITVIAGDCVPTAHHVLMRDDGTFAFYREELRPAEQDKAGTLFEPGDGTVPVSSARDGGEALLFCDGHQGIASDPNVHRAIIRALAF